MNLIKRILPRTLLGRSLIILVTPVVLIQIVAIYVFFDRHWNKMAMRQASALAGEILVVTTLFEENIANQAHENLELTESFRRFLDLHIVYRENVELPYSLTLSGGAIWETKMIRSLREALDSRLKNKFLIHTDFQKDDISVFIQLARGVIEISFPQRRLFSSSGFIFLLWMMGSSLLLLVVAIVFMRNQIRPIRKLAVAAERFGKGRDSPAFKPEGALEVRQAANAFLDMRRRIQRQITQRTEMLAGVSHDLRTPLTRMKLQLEMLPESSDVRDMKADIQEMERMIMGYLDFVRGDGDENYNAVDVAHIFDKLKTGLRHYDVDVRTDIEQGLRLTVRPLAFERALANILNNAAKYAQNIWVQAYTDDKKIHIQVEDDGPGIPEEMYDEVFRPFVRVDTSRNSETGGVGLGLAITMDIVHAHGGKIELCRSPHGGLCVKVRMP